MTTSTSTPNTKNGTAPKAQDETPRDLASAVTITYTPLTEVRANAQVPDVPLPVDLPTLTDEVLAALIQGARAELQQRRAKREADFFALVERAGQGAGRHAFQARGGARGEGTGRFRRRNDRRPQEREADLLEPQGPRTAMDGPWNPPKWMADHQEAGGTLEECLIPEGEL